VILYYEITIKPLSGGLWQAQPSQGEGWEDATDLKAEMMSGANFNGHRLVERNISCSDDIDWPSIVNEPSRVFALVEDDGTVAGYCGIEERQVTGSRFHD
jgi:hypothetical protein